MVALSYPVTLTVEHCKSASGTSAGSTHDFKIRAPSGEILFTLETESKHVQKVNKLVNTDEGEQTQQLAKIEWLGNGKDLVQIGESGESNPVAMKTLWDPPTFGERYIEGFMGADRERYTWSKVAIGEGREGVIEVHLTCTSSPNLIAKYTSVKLLGVPHTLSFGLPGKSKPKTTPESTSTLELSAESAKVGDVLFIIFLIALGRAHAATAFTIGGFIRHAVDTCTMDMM